MSMSAFASPKRRPRISRRKKRAKRMGEIEREIAKLDEPAGNGNDDDTGSDQARSL